MKRLLCLLALSLCMPLVGNASGLEMALVRKIDTVKKSDINSENPVRSENQLWRAEVKVTNRSFRASPALKARYIIYVKRQLLGQKHGDDKLSEVLGSADVEAIAPNTSTSIAMPEIALNQANLDAGYSFRSGGQTKAQDSVVGVWVKLFDGDKVVAEYLSNTTLKNKHEWKEAAPNSNQRRGSR